MAITAATLKAVDNTADAKVTAPFAALLDDTNVVGVIDHFVHLLDFSRADLFRSAQEVDKYLIPASATSTHRSAIFIDSIDEYFNNHILDLTPADAGELSPDIWYLAQMGLVEAAYELRRLTHHLKVFAAIRKEAFDRFGTATSMVQQYRGSTVDMRYRSVGLRAIFVNNIRREKSRNLADASETKREPFRAFLGLTSVRHAPTGRDEEIGAYVLRHTLGRPRDLMTIGGALSRIPPAQRGETTVKTTVNDAAPRSPRSISTRSRRSPRVSIWRWCSRCSPATSSRPTTQRRWLAATTVDSAARRRPTAAAGLPARGRSPRHGEHRSCRGADHPTLLRPGQQSFGETPRLPASTHYLVHPILSVLIRRVNDGYADAVDRANVIGDGLPWTDGRSEAQLCVMKADIGASARSWTASTRWRS